MFRFIRKKSFLMITIWVLCTAFMYMVDTDVVIWLIEIGMVFLIYHAWKWRKRSAVRSALLGSLAILVSGLIFEMEYMPELLVALLPVFIVLMFDWFVRNHMEKGIRRAVTQETRNRSVWCTFLLSCFFIFIIESRERLFFEYTWDVLFMAAVPIIYAILFLVISEHFDREDKKYCAKLSVGYFTACLAIFVFVGGVIFREYPHARLNWNLDRGCYLVVLSLIVYITEIKNIRISDMKARTRYKSILCALGYVISAIATTFLGNERLRTVIFYLGGPAVHIHESIRENWIGYRLDVMKQFASGNLNADTYYMMNSPIEKMAYKYGYTSILIVAVPILVLYLLITKWKFGSELPNLPLLTQQVRQERGKNESLNRMKNYIAVSYLIRGGIIVLYCVLVLPVSRLTFPFFSSQGVAIDLLILYYLIKEKRDSMEMLHRQN